MTREREELPGDISPDGREVWDWAKRMSHRMHLSQRAGDLRRSIADNASRCGSCQHWKLDSCPREKHDNRIGRKRGPSSGDYKCHLFVMAGHTAEWLDGQRAELARVESVLRGEDPKST